VDKAATNAAGRSHNVGFGVPEGRDLTVIAPEPDRRAPLSGNHRGNTHPPLIRVEKK
jgi:hypothetical protein